MFNFASIGLFLALLLSPTVTVIQEGIPVNTPLSLLIASGDACREIYCESGLEGVLDYEIYHRAILGASLIAAPKKDILTIIDYSKPSYEKRFYVIDLKNRKLLYNTLVAHGKNSGEIECTHFSNRPRSLQSSPGFYLTAESYSGRQGYSLRIDGLEPGINDLARARAIVIHGAEYVCQRYVEDFGYIGRSWGCPALPLDVNKKIIDLIKGGSCLYIHTDNPAYAKSSLLPASMHGFIQLSQ
jgi:hypothetical protein